MQKYCATSLFMKIKNAIVDEVRKNLRQYLIYLVCVTIGLIVGIFWGINLASNDVEINVINYIQEFVIGEQGVFSLFFNNVITFVVVALLLMFSIKFRFLIWVSLFFVSLLLSRGIRNGVYLICVCDVSGILSGVIFYIIFHLIYSIVLSISFVFIILNSKTCFTCNLKKVLSKLAILYGTCLLVTLLYSIIVSIVFCLLV